MRETLSRYDAAPRGASFAERVREAALHELGAEFAFRDLAGRFEEVPASRVKRVLEQLRREGSVTRVGAGRGARWVTVSRSVGE